MQHFWQQVLSSLRDKIPEQQFNIWISPLTVYQKSATEWQIFAPNRFILDWVKSKYLTLLNEAIASLHKKNKKITLTFAVGTAPKPAPKHKESVEEIIKPKLKPEESIKQKPQPKPKTKEAVKAELEAESNNFAFSDEEIFFENSNADDGSEINKIKTAKNNVGSGLKYTSNLRPSYSFANFVQGKTNQLAFVAAEQVAMNPKAAYNPLFIYGGVGLGKTHLMQAIGNQILKNNPHAKVVYLTSERFVGDMVTALQNNSINEFKRFYRSLDALLIDDIQFFAHKERSQEEFFHTFNALLEEGQQVVLTCDRFPKEMDGIEDRLKSRVGWGLTVHVEPPDLETRVAILLKKASLFKVKLGNEEAFFIAERLSSNVRELEGALRKIIAQANFAGQSISISQISEALKDLFAVQERMVSIENIQRVVVNYYQIKMADLFSKRRSRSVARPRQVAMALTKELTSHSLPEIGSAFGGRDHTTVLHAVRKVAQLCKEDAFFNDAYEKIKRSLTS